MVSEYGLTEVWIPSDNQIAEVCEVDPSKFGKSNIFMSPDFIEDYEGDSNEGALILI
jgi:hypothetical protein